MLYRILFIWTYDPNLNNSFNCIFKKMCILEIFLLFGNPWKFSFEGFFVFSFLQKFQFHSHYICFEKKQTSFFNIWQMSKFFGYFCVSAKTFLYKTNFEELIENCCILHVIFVYNCLLLTWSTPQNRKLRLKVIETKMKNIRFYQSSIY